VFAAGLLPVDLNNLFITDPRPSELVEEAEKARFPQTCCSWIKGIYGAVKKYGLSRIIGVVQGDCTNTHALMEVLRFEGVECLPFEYPYSPDIDEMNVKLGRFADRLGADLKTAEIWRERLDGARKQAALIDELTWKEGKVSGMENHLWLVSTSDFCGDVDLYERRAAAFVKLAKDRNSRKPEVRLGFVGVPPVMPGIYDFLELQGGHVVFNETQRQFSMPGNAYSLAEAYSKYTYPYGIFMRSADIMKQVESRSLDGIIHYVQSFCYRRMEDNILRQSLDVPVLTIECDRPTRLPGQLKTRLEAFVEMLQVRKKGRNIF
jgi:benzoyl-CoA reductase/2-hydroxyglutaryl-CoA dehydratase subunit BcrC/BadD/HgdB